MSSPLAWPYIAFLLGYEAKYPKASGCLAKDREVLLTFYDFPAPHWEHIRTTNPIESTLSTVKLGPPRHAVARMPASGDGLQANEDGGTEVAHVEGYRLLAQVVQGVKFKDRLQEEAHQVAA